MNKMTREEFGKKIKDIRISMELTQLEFAKELRWTNSQSVANVESGNTPFPPEKVKELCKLAPNINVDEIIEALAAVSKEDIKKKVYSSIAEDKKRRKKAIAS